MSEINVNVQQKCRILRKNTIEPKKLCAKEERNASIKKVHLKLGYKCQFFFSIVIVNVVYVSYVGVSNFTKIC